MRSVTAHMNPIDAVRCHSGVFNPRAKVRTLITDTLLVDLNSMGAKGIARGVDVRHCTKEHTQPVKYVANVTSRNTTDLAAHLSDEHPRHQGHIRCDARCLTCSLSAEASGTGALQPGTEPCARLCRPPCGSCNLAATVSLLQRGARDQNRKARLAGTCIPHTCAH